jgi:crossover junction endodeoxyribonuclease RusA
MTILALFIPGNPAPQGSKSFMGTFRGKGGRVHAKMVESSKKAPAWRTDVRSALIDDENQPKAHFDGPVHVELEFVMPRPLSTPKRSTPPAIKKPDLDKLQRAVFDAISSAGVWRDDSQVVSVQASKRLAQIGETSGLHLFVTVANEKREAA